MSVVATIPEAVVVGEYEVLLWLPDLAATLRGRPEYAVRLANAGVREPASGMNLFGARAGNRIEILGKRYRKVSAGDLLCFRIDH